MKAGNKKLEPDRKQSIKFDNSNLIMQEKDVQNHAGILNLLPLLSMLIAILPGMIRKSSGVEIAKLGILTLILTAATTFFIRMNAENVLKKKFAKSIISISYLVSLCLLMLIAQPEIFCFWMIGGFVVAMLIDSKLGLLLHFNLSFILGISFSLRPETVIYLLIIGILMSLLSAPLRQKSTVIYAAIILLSTNITLAFVINNFIFDANANYNYIISFFSIFVVIVTAFLLCRLYVRFTPNMLSGENQMGKEEEESSPNVLLNNSLKIASLEASVTLEKDNNLVDLNFPDGMNTLNESIPASDEISETLNAAMETAVSLQNHLGIRTSYELLNEEGNSLLIRLKNFSESLYEHSLRIGDISCRAARVIGADEKLAKAGGLYHEIGKINGKNYIEEGIKIAEEYTFPKELTLILKQHNIKYEKPTSVEAAIVMLSDNVISTIEYIDKTGDNKFTTNKIIDNIFQLRMEKGTFDNSGLSVKDFKQLKEFYQNEFSKNTHSKI